MAIINNKIESQIGYQVNMIIDSFQNSLYDDYLLKPKVEIWQFFKIRNLAKLNSFY
jgi:hypothetical protein